MNKFYTTIVSDDMILFPLELEHKYVLYGLAQDQRIWKYMIMDAQQKDDFDEYFKSILKDQASGEKLPYIVMYKNEIVGFTRYLNISFIHKRLEIGSTWYHPRVWGIGVNTLCKSLLLSHAFDTHGFNRVSFCTDVLNKRSQHAIQKLGALKEGVMRSHMIVQGGRVRDSVLFSLTKEDWKKKQSNSFSEIG